MLGIRPDRAEAGVTQGIWATRLGGAGQLTGVLLLWVSASEEVTSLPDDRAAVRIASAVPLAKVASAHVDAEDAEPAIRAAVAVVLEADLGSDDARFTVDEAEGHELQWYATQELADLVSRAS